MQMKIDWQPIEEMDAEDGRHTAYYSANIPLKKSQIVLEQIADGTWDVLRLVLWVEGTAVCSSPMVNCKTLASAKRWVSRYYNK